MPERASLLAPGATATPDLPAMALAQSATLASGAPVARADRRRVLFIEHAASRNGASLLLLELLQWLQGTAGAGHGLQCEVLCEARGPLLPAFRALAPTHALLRPYRLQGQWPLRAGQGVATWLDEHWFGAFLRWRRIDLVYANTAAAWPQVPAVLRSGVPLLWHIHELPYALDLTLRSAAQRALLAQADRVVAVSQPVADALVGGYGVAPERIDRVHGFVATAALSVADAAVARSELLTALGWPADAFVVGACGGPGWRKGSDLFLQIAARVVRERLPRPIHFLWVGGADGDVEARRFAHDVAALGLQGRCRLLPATEHVDRCYAAMDVLALTSREDPFPLVVLEAAGHGVPTVAFAGAGGAAEFVADGAGIVVPYLDLGAFAMVLKRLCAWPALRDALGENGRGKVQAQHRVATQGPLLLHSMRQCMDRRSRTA
ncbi:MAG: hypothetical protein RL227_73 [Pseudomonadota bacterium]|jgi:glycosyltransferase involved in cell wall biosynthesis